MGKHRLETSDDGSESRQEEEQAFLVEVITQARVINDRKREFEYHVKWYGYTSDDDTWEPEENVEACKRLLKSFWKNVGKEKRRLPDSPGTEYSASREWINKERRHFAEEMRKDKENKEEERKEKERLKKAKALRIHSDDDAPTQSRSVKQADAVSLLKDASSDSESSNEPLKAQLKKKGKEKEVPRTAPSSSTTIKLKIPQRPSIQTSSSTASTSKYAGLKIAKKPTGASLASPVDPLHSPSRDSFTSKPKPPPNTTFSASTSSVAQKVPPARDTTSTNQFLPPRPKPSVSTAPAAPAKPPLVSSEDVDNLLTTIMSFGQSEAQKPENLAKKPPQPPTTKPSTVVPSGLKFTKKWSWTGELFVDNAEAADKLCDITIHSTSETSEIGHRLGAILDNRDSIRFSKSYARSELNLILRGLRKVDQIAKIGHWKAEDKEPLQTLLKYLIARNLVISSPAINHLGHVAEMIIFPSANTDLCARLHVPLSYKSADCLLVALMPWHIPPSKYEQKHFKPDELRDSKFEKELEEVRIEFSTLASKPNVETALRILRFDHSFVKFLPSRKYCVWSFQVDAKPAERGRKFPSFPSIRLDTRALFEILFFMKADNVGYDSPAARIVFVHVGSVRNIWRLPGIVERRCNKPEVQFITYGTHESVNPDIWGFHEIYPLGGIVTFTATVMLENPIYVAELIEQIHKHPHWECYILPSVLAVFVRLSCPGEDPLSVYTREPYHFGRILEFIEEGKIALMQSPGLYQGRTSSQEEAERDKWITNQFTTITKTPFQLLEECWSTFVAEYSNKTETELRATIESEIVRDLTNLQTQKTIRESYRRFVVIKAVQDEHIHFAKDGFEWRTAHEFTFGDGFPVHCVDLTRGSDQPLAA